MIKNITGAGLDSSKHTRQISHLPVLVLKSAGGTTNNAKTNIVVGFARVVVVVASGRTTIPRIVVPGTAAFAGLPHPYPIPYDSDSCSYSTGIFRNK